MFVSIQVSGLLSKTEGFPKFGRHGEVCWSLCLAALRALRQLMEVWMGKTKLLRAAVMCVFPKIGVGPLNHPF